MNPRRDKEFEHMLTGMSDHRDKLSVADCLHHGMEIAYLEWEEPMTCKVMHDCAVRFTETFKDAV